MGTTGEALEALWERLQSPDTGLGDVPRAHSLADYQLGLSAQGLESAWSELGIAAKVLMEDVAARPSFVPFRDRVAATHCPADAIQYTPYGMEPQWLHRLLSSYLNAMAATLHGARQWDGSRRYRLPDQFWAGYVHALPQDLTVGEGISSELIVDFSPANSKGGGFVQLPWFSRISRVRMWRLAHAVRPQLIDCLHCQFARIPEWDDPDSDAYQMTVNLSFPRSRWQLLTSAAMFLTEKDGSVAISPEAPVAMMDAKTLWAAAFRHSDEALSHVLPSSVPVSCLDWYVERYVERCEDKRWLRLFEKFEDMDEPFVARVMVPAPAGEGVVQELGDHTARQWEAARLGRNRAFPLPTEFPVDHRALWQAPYR